MSTSLVLDSERSAEYRILVLFGRFIGVGYTFYLLVSIPSMRVLDEVMRPWWTPVAVALFFGPGLALMVVSFLRPERTILRFLSAAAALSYLFGCVTWPLGWTGELIAEDRYPWFAGFPALATLCAAFAVRPILALAHLAAAVFAAQAATDVMTPSGSVGPLSAEFVCIYGGNVMLAAAAIMAARTGRLLDHTRDSTYSAAARAATLEARTFERRRFDGLVHDQVLSTLLTASRSRVDDANLALQANAALAELDSLRDGTGPAAEFSPSDVVAHLRATAAAVDPLVNIDVRVEGDVGDGIAADPVRTVGAAMAEAVRNSVRHAGRGAVHTVSATVTTNALQVTVVDNGAGFDPESIPAHRMGVRVSILERMTRLAGGEAELHSSPGGGTVVMLSWRWTTP